MPGFAIGTMPVGGSEGTAISPLADLPFYLHHRVFALKAVFDKTAANTACFAATTTAKALYSKDENIPVTISF